MTLVPKGLLLLAGTVIQVIYPSYGWNSPGKKFRIDTITYQPDGLVDVVAKEYDTSFYSLGNIKAPYTSGPNTTPSISKLPTNNKPSGLTATQNRYNQILLEWNPGIGAGASSFTEIWRAETNNFSQASVIALVPVVPGTTNSYIDAISPELVGEPYIPRYYWVRRRITT